MTVGASLEGMRVAVIAMLTLALLACSDRSQTQRVVEVAPNLPGIEDDGTWDGSFEPDGACPASTSPQLANCDGTVVCIDDDGGNTSFAPVCPPIVVRPPPRDAAP
jgi:hypothetical protein